MKAPKEVGRLVERFRENREAYLSTEYNELTLRREFLEPFFKALGWDVDNEQGHAEAYKDVIHEDAIKVGGVTKAPDYAFRIGGTRKFFVEAKRPSVGIKDDPNAAYQLRRYAWSAKLPLSILTDFEEFAVYDCRVRPNKDDKASTARTFYFTYDEYESKWDEIAGIFSRDAILTGSFDKYVEAKRKRGTAEVDDAFLKEIEGWRDVLARNIALRNTGLSNREVNFAVQRTIDRIIFLRICEDRGIEGYGQLMALRNAHDVYQRLCEVFRNADDRYNSGLFHFRKERGRGESPDELTLGLEIDDKVLKDVFKDLYYPDSPYEFSVLPADILGHIYEQFLGKVIRLTPAHRAVVEEKPEVRKAGGVYYTPTYIVDYIVEHTVGKLLEGKTPNQVAKLRVLDLACGSGSFLLGAYQRLLDWHLTWCVENEPAKHAKGRKPKVFQGPGGDWRLTTAEKKRILLNNIYGVDIDPQAVEVTKLSLLLKVLDGESEETLGKTLRMFHERALPDLGENIKCGNSLIGPDFYEGKQLSLIDEEERYRINAFDWGVEFSGIIEAGGFDAVIGNPPYIRIQRIPRAEADYAFAAYESANGKADLSVLFLERAFSLLNKRGLAGFICTSQWLQTDYGKGTRRMLSDGRLHELVDFGSLSVFRGASTYPAIVVLGPRRVPRVKLKSVPGSHALNLETLEGLSYDSIATSSLSESPWSFGQFSLEDVLEGQGLGWQPLGDWGAPRIGAKSGMNDVFVISRDLAEELGLESELLLPYAYRGSEIARFCHVAPQALLIYPYQRGQDGSSMLIGEEALRAGFPNVHEYLVQHKARLRERRDTRRLYATGEDWYRHLRPGSFEYIDPGKIVFKGIAMRSCAGLLEGGTAFDGANCPAIAVEGLGESDVFYLLGILNSRVAAYYFRQVCPAKLSGYIRMGSTQLSRLPVRDPKEVRTLSPKNLEQLVASVNRMVDLCQRKPSTRDGHGRDIIQREIDATDTRIDQLVYELYGLAEKEIRIVEEATK